MANTFTIRDILLVDFPPQTPALQEQQGTRPAVVVGRPSKTGTMRFELVIVVPITRQSGDWTAQNPILYPSLQAGMGNLTAESIVLLDKVRAVDIR